MWKVTSDEIWRQRGWEIYQSIEKYCRTPAGYASVFNVGQNEPVHSESMPRSAQFLMPTQVCFMTDWFVMFWRMYSYFMAETLKYIFLLFTDKDPISFDKWMFNTCVNFWSNTPCYVFLLANHCLLYPQRGPPVTGLPVVREGESSISHPIITTGLLCLICPR